MKAKSQVSMFQVSEINLSYYPKFKACERPKVTTSQQAYNILYNNWNLNKLEMQEQFYILLLNRNNNILGMSEISAGGLTATVADPKAIFTIALKSNSAGLILAHNHPSGNLKPSQADINLTRRLVEVGKLLDLQVIDHIILTRQHYYSFGDEGLI